MSINVLEQYLPENTLPFLKKWFADYFIHIKITKNRNSKLGDYRKLPDKSHQITVNSTLDKQLFFFVLTHELAHLIAFENFNFRISAHGKEWKDTFKEMLLESIDIYTDDLKPIIKRFSKNPKANFMASPELVRYFHIEDPEDRFIFVEDLSVKDNFHYKGDKYEILEKKKKLYLCINLNNSKKYLFRPLAKVEKLTLDEE
ncbi:SprT-like domain-containing protein [Epilithonimonas arachidiradicis]|uniref:Metallopeptidase n=1 Tax=Epilithonimonas arachidiradicis TaxID=1617282 RepID=A0A420DD15_9FLAO|nr:SprT-like domain-containing protein [Epilithonimonas arachidiradicis]RKE89672.1 SprT-like family protein [Epilithonimonas arachidiradicis]GGG44371.1 metallopeptidase [Epilithonimonas arachidiradicis]